MSKAYEIFDAAFAKPRDPRSDEYRHGVIDILKFRLGEANEAFGKKQYVLGTAQADAYFAGCDEGHRLAREHLEKVGAGTTATVTREMIGAAHDVMLAKGDFVLSANLLERIYLAMDQAAPPPPPQTPFNTCPTCESLARTVMMDQTGAA